MAFAAAYFMPALGIIFEAAITIPSTGTRFEAAIYIPIFGTQIEHTNTIPIFGMPFEHANTMPIFGIPFVRLSSNYHTNNNYYFYGTSFASCIHATYIANQRNVLLQHNLLLFINLNNKSHHVEATILMANVIHIATL